MVTCLLSEHTVTLCDSVASGLLLFTLSGVDIVLLVRNPRYLFDVYISLLRPLKLLLLLGGGILGFTRCAPPTVFGL